MKSNPPRHHSHGIRINTLSPGYMDTILNEGDGIAPARQIWSDRNPMGRMGAVGELDGVVVLLCSRAGSYITGADFVIDGEFFFFFLFFFASSYHLFLPTWETGLTRLQVVLPCFELGTN